MTKIRSMQRAMERIILQIKLKDKIPHRDIRKKDKFQRRSETHWQTKMEMGRARR